MLVHDAVAFWNQTLAGLGSSFRLGAISGRAGDIPAADLIAASEATLGQSNPPLPASVLAVPGNIVVALSSGDFVSFCARRMADAKALVSDQERAYLPADAARRGAQRHRPRTGPCARIGSQRGPDDADVRPTASCRPAAFAASPDRYFTLTDDETRLLLALYPAGWRPR